MKFFTEGIFARRKIVLLFLLAILLPSLVVGYLSFETFSEKQKAVQNFLESNLWISGESALKAIETGLLELEESALRRENFSESFGSPDELRGKLFLVDENFEIVFPRTKHLEISDVTRRWESGNGPFSESFRTAEMLEFEKRDYSRALEEYRVCLSLATSEAQKAGTLEALGRCLLAEKIYDEAYKTYAELATKYGRLLNKAGHPFELTAHLQLIEIGEHLDDVEKDIGSLFRLYENLQNGEYPVTLSAYEFFQNEIQTILDAQGKRGDIQYKNSPYLETLLFADFLEREAVPKLAERRGLIRWDENSQTDRFLIEAGDTELLVSCRTFPGFRGKKTFYGGFCWDLDAIKTEVFPVIIRDLEKNSKLHLGITDDKDKNVFAGNEGVISDEALALPFRQFPFPWRLVVTQPALDEVVRTTRRDNVFYGILLGFVVVLMLFGAALIARDISRETETTRLKTEFVHHVSHELKTPLTLIRLYGETLQRKKGLSESDKDEAYEIITKESERLSHLINNVLDFSRIEMGKKEFYFKKGDLVGVVRETLESYRYHLEKKGFAVKEEIACDLPEMTFDSEGIASILVNLLSNAIKFSPDTLEVVVRLFEKDNHAVLQIEDKGIGISSREISRVFEKFYRSSDVKAADAKGSGLGLTLVKHIAEAHGGQVQVQSEPGRGSEFSILLPLSKSGKENK